MNNEETMLHLLNRIDTRTDRIDGRVDALDRKVGALDVEVKVLGEKFSGLEKRMDKVEHNLERVEHKLEEVEDKLKGAIGELAKSVKGTDLQVAGHEALMGRLILPVYATCFTLGPGVVGFVVLQWIKWTG